MTSHDVLDADVPLHHQVYLHLLAALDDPRGENQFWQRIGPEQPVDVRGAALQALGKRPLASTKDHLKKLLTCALDRDFGIVAPALLLLKTVSVNKRNVGDWQGLFDAPDVAVRHFALEHVAAAAPAETLPGVLAQLDHPDASLRQKALALLAQTEAGQKALARTLVEEKNVDRAWALARALSERVASFPASWRKEVFERVSRFLEAGDQHAEPLLFLLRLAEAKELRERLEEKAAALRKKKTYDKALHYLRVLGKDPACAFPMRLELAACGLKVSGHDLAPDAAARRIVARGNDGEQDLAVELDPVAGEDRVVAGMDRRHVVGPGNVRSCQHGNHAWRRLHCRQIHAGDPRMRLRGQAGRGEERSRRLGDVVDIDGAAGHMLARAVMGDGIVHATLDQRGCDGGLVSHGGAPPGARRGCGSAVAPPTSRRRTCAADCRPRPCDRRRWPAYR